MRTPAPYAERGERDEIYGCLPFATSTDRWRWGTVRRLGRLLAAQQTPPEQSAALILGTSGLPYLLGMLRVGTLYNVDLSADVLNATAERFKLLTEHDNWRDYNDATAPIVGPALQAQELWLASRGHLSRGYDKTRAGAEQARLRSYEGDLLTLALPIGEHAVNEGQTFTFVNVTNVPYWVSGEGRGDGRSLVANALRSLPLAPDAVIVDSSQGLVPKLFNREQYLGK